MYGLYRPENGKMIGGVCAGLGLRFGLPAGMVRFNAILSCLLPGPQFVLYIALWIILPTESRYVGRS
jgi:phage shock protein PspC (stress-responsive transcriptional regulator)